MSEESEDFADIKKSWERKAADMKPEGLMEFLRHLHEDYIHDYGTIVHAMSTFSVAAAWSFNKSEQGGITGFQAGFVMWGFISQWQNLDNEIGLKLIDMDDLLFPQYEYKFTNTISEDQAKKLKELAAEKLEKETTAGTSVKNHWESLANGDLPFGFILKED